MDIVGTQVQPDICACEWLNACNDRKIISGIDGQIKRAAGEGIIDPACYSLRCFKDIALYEKFFPQAGVVVDRE